MIKNHKNQKDDTNYSFLLKCMAALTAAAIITAGIIAAITLKATATTAAAVAANMMLGSAFFAFTPAFPVILVVIGFVCLLPFLFSCNNNTTTTIGTNPGYGIYGSSYYPGFYSTPSYSSSNYYLGTNPGPGNIHVHNTSGNMHGHNTPGNVHGHSTSGNVHGHIGGHVHGHDSQGNVHEHRF